MAAIVLTGAFTIVSILVLDIESIAKLASAFQLHVFATLSLAVVIMRESRIPGYVPVARGAAMPHLRVS